jgi:hypothetical protein
MSKKPGLLDHAKEVFAAVESTYKVLALIFPVIFSGLALITTSYTFRVLIIASVVVGGLLGFFVTVVRMRGEERGACLKLRKRCLVTFPVAAVIIVLTMQVLEPDVARLAEWIAAVREFLIKASVLTNCLIFAAAATGSYCLVAAIALSSKQLCTGKAKKRQTK